MQEGGRSVIGVGILSAEGLTDANREVQTIDARSKSDFDAGHIPGAIWMGWEEWCEPAPGPREFIVPFTTLFDATGRYIDRERYVGGLPPAVRQADNIVAYCEVGVRASLFALLHEAYAGRLVSVCDGSLTEWAITSRLPLQTGTSSRQRTAHRRRPLRSLGDSLGPYSGGASRESVR
jgi:3-mercaptopyruvate sulfurtransferase SseA